MFFQLNLLRAKAILRIPSWNVKHPPRRPHNGQNCERLHHPSSPGILQNFSNLSRILRGQGVLAEPFERLHHYASSVVLLFLLVQNASNLSRILPPFFWKKQGEYALDMLSNSTTLQVLGVYLSCHFSIGLVDLELGLRPSFILNDKLVTPALDLFSWRWAIGPASFLIKNYDCFWTWMLGHWTCHTCIGFVNLKLNLWPSFILNDKSCLFLDLDVGRGALSLRHWTCHLEAGPSAQLYF